MNQTEREAAARQTEHAKPEEGMKVTESHSDEDADSWHATELPPAAVVMAAVPQEAPGGASAQAAGSSPVELKGRRADFDIDGGGCRRQLEDTRSQYPLPIVVHDTSPWQRYRGYWGSVVSATQQGWFLGPEPPVSRGCLRRLFLPFARGVERLEPAKAASSAPSALKRLITKVVR
ncbi:hypothetical protein Vretifemale_2315 [Volvox reticuliferus]|nr:hypothetical protein Vretifemale_2315 [Volvox reticuliferus]